MSVPHIVTEFQVTDSIKGDVLPGTVINVTQVGGTVDGIKIREKNTIPLQEVDTTHGKQLLLLLNKHEDGTFDPIQSNRGSSIRTPPTAPFIRFALKSKLTKLLELR